MKLEFKNLLDKNFDELIKFFLSIPKRDNRIEFRGPFHFIKPFGSIDVAKALTYLPKHISIIKFDGVYTYIGKAYNVNNNILGGSRNVLGSVANTLHYTRSLDSSLKIMIKSLPNSVNTLILSFGVDQHFERNCFSTNLRDNFKAIFKNLRKSITHLNLLNTELEDDIIPDIMSYIPETVINFYPGNLRLGSKNLAHHDAFFSSFKPNLTKLNLDNNQLSKLHQEVLPLFARYSPKTLKTLGLRQNNLNKKNAQQLKIFFSSLPVWLEELGLSGNNLSEKRADILADVLSSIRDNIKKVDLGENGLLLLPKNELSIVLQGLPKTLKSFRLCDNEVPLKKLMNRMACLPSHIQEISFSDSNLLGLNIAEFGELLTFLPVTIRCLDLSGNSLSKQLLYDLDFVSRVPSHIKILKLSRNNLSDLDVNILRKALFSQNIIEFDLSENGFERQNYSLLSEQLGTIPNTVKHIVLDNQFCLRNDGALLPNQSIFAQNPASPKKRFRQQKEFNSLRLVLMQMIEYGKLSLDTTLLILTFLLNPSIQELRRMEAELETIIFPSALPEKITSDLQQEVLNEVHHRIFSASPGSKRINLSRCGLNRLDKVHFFQEIFTNLPVETTSLSLRGNGFHYNEKTKRMLIAALAFIPKWISYLDLSDHNFEGLNAENLQELFVNMPSTVRWVFLGHEKPISPTQHIARRDWKFNQALTQGVDSIFQQALILLNDYTKNDSACKRFFSGNWNHHHVNKVSALVKQIEYGLITNCNDLFFELEQIPLVNQAGSLASRFSFLLKQKITRPDLFETEEKDSINIIEIDDREESSSHFVLNCSSSNL